jgi:PKD repeat protein
MLADYQNRLAGFTNLLTLPSGHDAAAYGQTCAVCHDPHSVTSLSTNVVYTTNVLSTTNIFSNYGIKYTNVVYTTNVTSATSVVKVPYQLRNPMWSSNYFSFFPAAATNTSLYTNFDGVVTGNTNYGNDGFLAQYNPNIQICGQCHNSRGARWDGVGWIWSGTNFVASAPDFSREPHESPQYNILIGILQPDYLNSTNGKTVWTNSVLNNGIGIYATHSGIAPRSVYNTNQCATCHVPIYTANGASVSGHSFAMDINGCALGGCHTSGAPNYRATQVSTTNRINGVVALLRAWATSQGPALFPSTYQNYGQNAWEYTTPGELGDGSTNQGPSAVDQPSLPDVIKQARFDLYMVNNDGSKGVHNPTFIPILLSDAETKVRGLIASATSNIPPMFTANIYAAFTNAPVVFNNLTVGLGARVTNCVWNFGNVTVTNLGAFVTNSYASAGSYTVSLTTTDTNGATANLTIPGYINVFLKPVPSFSYTPGPYTFPTTVKFTNNSANANYFVWAFMSGVSGAPVSLLTNPPPFTYTNGGIYNVKLTAYNEAGSVAITNTIGVGPYASFVANTTLGAAPLTSKFTTTSAGVINYNWSFGDGQSSTLANPTNTYAGNGAYTVTLTVDNGVLTNTLVKTNYITVASPVAAFTASTTSGTHPLAVTFTNLSTFASSYKWTFGVGSLSSTSTSPSFTYTNAGTYTVTLQAINTGATNTLVTTNYITAN